MPKGFSYAGKRNLYRDEEGNFWVRWQSREAGREFSARLKASGIRDADAEAAAWVAGMRKKKGPGRPKGRGGAVPIWEEAVESWVAGMAERPDIAPKTAAYYRERAGGVVELAEGVQLDRITEAMALAWWRGRAAACAPHHANVQLSMVRRIFARAIEKGWASEDPSAGIQRLPVGDRRIILPSAEDFARILDAMPDGESKNMVRWLAYSGMRIGELRRLEWADVERGAEKVSLTVASGKTRGGSPRFRRVPANASLCALVAEMEAGWLAQDMVPVGPVFRIASPRRAFDNAQERAGVGAHMRIHDLRHLFATRCIESGVDIPTVSRWLGHSDGGVLAMRTYGHLRDEHSQAQAARVVF
jgi:integrase